LLVAGGSRDRGAGRIDVHRGGGRGGAVQGALVGAVAVVGGGGGEACCGQGGQSSSGFVSLEHEAGNYSTGGVVLVGAMLEKALVLHRPSFVSS
jgi:hypothetical protein